jgi:EmrB/QacA subfamily drug resistance transporter
METTETDARTQNAALIVSMISALFNSMGNSAVSVALPAIGSEFSMSAVLLGWVVMSMMLSSSIFIVPFGRLADIYGRKKMMIIGTSVYTIFSVLAALSVNSFVFILSRAAQGIGAGMLFGTGVAILTSVFPPEKRGWALGWNVSAVYIGLSAGPLIGGILTARFGWRYIFWLNLPLGLISLIFLIYVLKGEWAEAKGEKLDIGGSFILGTTITCVIYGLSKMPSAAGACFVAAGLTAGLIFVKFEEKQDNAVVDVKLFEGNPSFTFSNLATLIHYSSAFSVGMLMSLYLQYVKGFDPANAGIILMSQPVIMAVFAPMAGRLSDRTHPAKIASIGMAVTTIGLILFTFIGQNTHIIYIVICLIFIGFGFALFSSPNTNAVMSSVERRNYGVAAGLLSTMRQAGQMTGMAIATMMFSIFIGTAKIVPENNAAFLTAVRVAFIVSSIMCFFGIFACLAGAKGKIVKKK